MSENLTKFLTEIRELLSFAPDWAVALVLLALAILAALAVHKAALVILRRALPGTHPYLMRLVYGTRGPSRLALLLFALAVTVPVAPLSPETVHVWSRLLFIGTIILLGWIAVTAIHLAADLYLLRFRIDVADNLLARKHYTQIRILTRAGDTLVILLTAGFALMTFESVRQYGVSLFASAGVAGIVVGLALRPLLSNLLAGVQLAVTQPIRLEDAVVVENEWGWIEEITATYVVIRIWDLRRLVVPLSYFIEKPFQNWTREGSAILGAVLLYLDYRAPIDAIRAEAKRIVEASSNWNRKVFGVQVTDAKENTIEVRILVSANDGGKAFDLRCEVREKIIDFLQREHADALPRQRQENFGAISEPPAEARQRLTHDQAAE